MESNHVVNGLPETSEKELNGHDDHPALADQLALLQTALRDVGLPPTVDRTMTSHRQSNYDVTIVLLADLKTALPIFFEGYRQLPGSVVLVLTSSWLSRDPSPSDPSLQTLHVHKGVTADGSGSTYLDLFTPPRRVTCLVNLTGTVDFSEYGQKSKKIFMACNNSLPSPWNAKSALPLDTPMSGSPALGLFAQNRLTSRILCAEAGVAHPATLAILLPSEENLLRHINPPSYPSIRVVVLKSRDTQISEVEKIVREFVCSDLMHERQKVFLKHTSGADLEGSNGKLHGKVIDATDVTAIAKHVLDLLAVSDLVHGVLVESYHVTVEPVVPRGAGRHAVNFDGIKREMTITAFVNRTPQNGACLSDILCEIRDANSPAPASSHIPVSLELALRKWGIVDVKQQRDTYDTIRNDAETLMTKLMENEAAMNFEQRGGHTAQTDTIGVEFVLTTLKNTLTPVFLRFHSYDHLHQAAVCDTLRLAQGLRAQRGLVQTLAARSLRFVMASKVVIIVGGWKMNKRHILETAVDLGVKIILLDENPEHPFKDKVSHFLHVPNMRRPAVETDNAQFIVRLLRSTLGQDFHIDGCLTFLESLVRLTSLVAESLNLSRWSPSYEATGKVRRKISTQQTLGEKQEVPAHWVAPALFASPVARVRDVGDLDEAMKKIPLPAVLKTTTGSSGRGVMHISTRTEAELHLEKVQKWSSLDETLGSELFMMRRLDGTEHSIDIVLFEGQIVAAFVADKGPTRMPACWQTATVMPSLLSEEEQGQLMMAATTCCCGVGLHTGVFNLDMMMTPVGPRLVEINARMGGFSIYHWLRRLYDIDLVHLAIMVACGVRPVGVNSLAAGTASSKQIRQRKGMLMGLNLWSNRHQAALTTTATPDYLQQLHQQGTIVFTQLKEEVSRGYYPFGNIAVCGRTPAEAKMKLTSVCECLGLETKASMEEVLQDFPNV